MESSADGLRNRYLKGKRRRDYVVVVVDDVVVVVVIVFGSVFAFVGVVVF